MEILFDESIITYIPLYKSFNVERRQCHEYFYDLYCAHVTPLMESLHRDVTGPRLGDRFTA